MHRRQRGWLDNACYHITHGCHIDKFREWHTLTPDEMLRNELVRQPFWSEAFAVGDEGWLKNALENTGRKRMKIKESNGIKFSMA